MACASSINLLKAWVPDHCTFKLTLNIVIWELLPVPWFQVVVTLLLSLTNLWFLGVLCRLSSNMYNHDVHPPLPAQRNLPPPPTLYPQQPVSNSENYGFPRIYQNISSEFSYSKSKRTDIDVWLLGKLTAYLAWTSLAPLDCVGEKCQINCWLSCLSEYNNLNYLIVSFLR